MNLIGILNGKLTSSIGDISEFWVLSIPNNLFYDENPKSIGKLQLLEVLQLKGNNFSGKISDQINYLESLCLLNLSNNAFSGLIPSKLIGFGNISVVDDKIKRYKIIALGVTMQITISSLAIKIIQN